MEYLRDQYAEVAEYWRHIAQEVDNLGRLQGELRVKSAPDFRISAGTWVAGSQARCL
jgi:hypothetical protein